MPGQQGQSLLLSVLVPFAHVGIVQAWIELAHGWTAMLLAELCKVWHGKVPAPLPAHCHKGVKDERVQVPRPEVLPPFDARAELLPEQTEHPS